MCACDLVGLATPPGGEAVDLLLISGAQFFALAAAVAALVALD